MDPDCFTMSQYQFVNSLASCYPPTGNTNNNNTTTPNQANPNSDYFPANTTYNPNLYPNTPQAHYANQAYNIGGNSSGQANPGAGGAQPNPTDMVDYTQLQPQRLLLQNQQQQAQSQPQNQQQNPQQAQASCKYANDPTTTTPTGNNNQSISSPQDLSSTRDISPKLSPSSVVESVARSLNKSVVGSSVAGGANVTSTSLTSSLSNNHNTNIPIPMHSPAGDSDSESDSGNEAGSSQNSGNGKKGNPPQIYPWMKRVHIGQSKYKIFSLYHLLFIFI